MKLGKDGVMVVGGWKGTQLPPRMMRVPWPGPPHASTCVPPRPRPRCALLGRHAGGAATCSAERTAAAACEAHRIVRVEVMDGGDGAD